MAKNEVAKLDDFPAMIRPASEVAEIVRDNVGDLSSPFDLQRIEIPKSDQWTISTLEGEETTKVLRCIIVEKQNTRSFWHNDEPSGDPPDCRSDDAVMGVGDPGGECGACPYSQWDSSPKGGGQACKAKLRLFLMLPGSLLPTLLVLPPSSLKPFRKIMFKLATAGISYRSVLMNLGLVKQTKPGGIKYATIDPDSKVEAYLSQDQCDTAKALGLMCKPFARVHEMEDRQVDLGSEVEMRDEEDLNRKGLGD